MNVVRNLFQYIRIINNNYTLSGCMCRLFLSLPPVQIFSHNSFAIELAFANNMMNAITMPPVQRLLFEHTQDAKNALTEVSVI